MLPCGCRDSQLCTHPPSCAILPFRIMPALSSASWGEWINGGAKWTLLNGLNLGHRLTTTIQISVLTYLGLKVFYEDDQKYGGVDADFWAAPNTIIFTLMSILVGLGSPIWYLIASAGKSVREYQEIIERMFGTLGGAGLISYLSNTYQAPVAVKWALIALTSAPFIMLLFCMLGIKISSGTVQNFFQSIKKWLDSKLWLKMWGEGACAGQGTAAIVSAMIDYWYNSSHEVNFNPAREKQLVLTGLLVGFFIGAAGAYINGTYNHESVKKVGKLLDKIGTGVFCSVNYLMLMTAAYRPTIFEASVFNGYKGQMDAILALFTAAATSGAAVTVFTPELPRKLPPYPSRQDIRENTSQIVYWLLYYVIHVLGITLMWGDVARDSLSALWAKFKSPEEHQTSSSSSLTEQLLPPDGELAVTAI